MSTLSEDDSLRRVARYGIPVVEEVVVTDADAATAAATRMGFPVVAKLTGAGIAHKTERGLVRLGLRDAAAVGTAAGELLAAARPEDGEVGILVAPMLSATRELIAGLHHDDQFGPCVMVGIGGVAAEALGDVSFRLVPITPRDAAEMLDDLRTQALLGPFRGEPAVERDALAAVLVGLSALATAEPEVAAVDLNPVLIVDGRPVAVDALVEVADGAGA